MDYELTARAPLLALHIAGGSAAIVFGAAALLAPKRGGRHPRCGVVYQGALAATAVSAIGLAALAWQRLWWLAVIGLATEACGLGGLVVRRRARPGWLPWHIRLMGASYISLLTALLVVNWGSPIGWIVPTAAGSPLIARAAARARFRVVQSGSFET